MDSGNFRNLAVITTALLMVAGCATVREHRTACIVAGAVVGGAAVAAAADQNKGNASTIGAGAGALTAWFLCGEGEKPVVLDRDGDGVPDSRDTCAGTPANVTVDTKGCPLDGDMDGVADYLDQCANTRRGTAVNSMGCSLDQCAHTRRGTAVNSMGCSLDSDGDGVSDSSDMCPGTPAGREVDAQGCERVADSDGDGVSDAADECPGTPAGRMVDARGCEPNADSDGDGVRNAADLCPGTLAGRAVNPHGCEPDDDGDGVANAFDACPGTPARLLVDQRGCHVLFSLQGLNFASNSFALTDAAKTQLQGAITQLKQNPETRVQIEGHSDSTGREAYNVQLSGSRANAVRDYLIAQGIDAGRLQAKGFGSSIPVATNETVEGRAKNRRVDFTLLNQ